MRWHLGVGTLLCFLGDLWLPGHYSLASYACCLLLDIECNKKVAEFANPDGFWKVDLFEPILPFKVVNAIVSMRVPYIIAGQDSMPWSYTADGDFFVKSAYMSFVKPDVHFSTSNLWRLIWKWNGPAKISSFLWLLAHYKILTKSSLAPRHISSSDRCPFNCNFLEPNLHCYVISLGPETYGSDL